MYLGLVPSENSSGERQQRGRLTKTGNRRLRYLLVEAAWSLSAKQKGGHCQTTKMDAGNCRAARQANRGRGVSAKIGGDFVCDVARRN